MSQESLHNIYYTNHLHLYIIWNDPDAIHDFNKMSPLWYICSSGTNCTFNKNIQQKDDTYFAIFIRDT